MLGAIVGGDGAVWGAERLEGEVRRRAAGLRHRCRALITHGGTPEFFADILAVWRRGGCAACAGPSLTTPERENLVRFLKPDAVLDGAGVPEGSSGGEPVETAPDDPALILFTSGTTGTPKGVVHTFGSLHNRIQLNRRHLGDEVLARTLCILPTHFGHGLIGNSLTPLLAGHTLFLAPPEPARMGRLIDENAITFFSSVPALWTMVPKLSPPPQNRTLRQISVGSAPLAASVWRSIIEWGGTRNVVNMYGITEAANWIAGASAVDHEPADGLIGRAWGGALGVVVDGEVRASGEGELAVKSDCLMKGYYNRPDWTREVIVEGWFRTGDIGTIDEDGVARLQGRRRLEINRAGIKIHPEEIDLLLEGHPQVVEACTFAVPDEFAGEIVGVAVRAAVEVSALRAWCRERLRKEAVPERWFLVDESPRTDRGKVDRASVRALCLGESA